VTINFLSALPSKFVPTLPDRLSIQGFAPIVTTPEVAPTGTLSLQGFAPTISIA
jgi:hypothetical protein